MYGLLKVMFTIGISVFFFSCGEKENRPDQKVIGFLDAVEDATLALAADGFKEALEERGLSEEEGNLRIISRNAQGDMSLLVQSLQYFTSTGVDLIAANSTISTITAVQRSRGIPICMMVAPEPHMAGLTNSEGQSPDLLFGVYETLDYIDTSLAMILDWVPDVQRVGLIYNQAETQSLNALERVRETGAQIGLEIIALPVTNSSETQLVSRALIDRKIDVFFALPDNIIFSSFEVVLQNCNRAGVPIFTSEAGLVARGAVAAFGADFYQWGYQAGILAADYFENEGRDFPGLERVKNRSRVYNPESAERFSLSVAKGYQKLEL